MEELILTNIKSHVTRINKNTPIVTAFSAKYFGREKSSLMELVTFRINIWPAHLFSLEIDLDFTNIEEKKFGFKVNEINFIEKHMDDGIIEVTIIPSYCIDMEGDNKKIKLRQQYKYNASFGKSTIIFKIAEFEEKIEIHKKK